jgi:hypothetical protein
MGQEISAEHFKPEDFQHFKQRLQQETFLLETMLNKQAFSEQKPFAGFEIEAWLLDYAMCPAPVNDLFLSSFDNPLACEELAKFNIELNSTPWPLRGDVLKQLHQQFQTTWNKATAHAQSLDKALLMIGILPTLLPADLTLANMSNRNRYRALNEQILKSRGEPVHLDIIGVEHLKLDHDDVMMEAATTSFQIHIQVPAKQAHHFYNASIIASAFMVGVCANSPFLFSQHLWHESRIPLFEQAIETGGYAGAMHGPLKRVSFGTGFAKQSILECFKENLEHFPVLLPECLETNIEEFAHLRLHNGTIWRWNRPLLGFSADGSPHIRIEHRVPAAGPTVLDSIANIALFYGLCKSLCDDIMTAGLPLTFSQAKDNFYQAARYGLDAHILWKDGQKHRLHWLLSRQFIDQALKGLESLGIDPKDSEYYLAIIRDRVNNRQTGSLWQQNFIQHYGKDFQKMTQQYLKNQNSPLPVSQWEL